MLKRLERRAIDAFVKLGVSMTDTCINYQTIQAPTRGARGLWRHGRGHLLQFRVRRALQLRGRALGAPAGLTGRTPRYGYHLVTSRHTLQFTGIHARGAQRLGSAGRGDREHRWHYWDVPVVEGLDRAPPRIELKHLARRWRASVQLRSSTCRYHARGVPPWRTWPAAGLGKIRVGKSRRERVAEVLSRRQPAWMSSCSPPRSSPSTSCARSPSSAGAGIQVPLSP